MSNVLALFCRNLCHRWTEWQQRHVDFEVWSRLRALWEQR